ncbi:MAG: dihydroxyacetone kinase subunit DhaK [Bacteroidetes bacterium]|jgi:dihydroxyacetone kinase-like protein|nr:dihydroxyacetone kinase subunit DhaK [Bacteroidota bacterium]
MKKLINKPENVLKEQLEGFQAAHADHVNVHFDPTFITRSSKTRKGKVALISGGGSGHEPMHGGFVGAGMLDAACPGEIFTSPTPDQMHAAAKACDSGAGVLNIVKNYTGDVMNFEMAADLAREEDIKVQNIVIDDDIAVKDSLYTAGRRGVGTTVLAEKICGGAAEDGYTLEKLSDLCRKVNRYGRSMGMALTSCITPENGTPSFDIGDDEIEIGIGIHGEPGMSREKIKPADEITERMTTEILDETPYKRTLKEWNFDEDDWVEVEVEDAPFKKGDSFIVFVNSMGGTPVSELYAVYRKVAEVLDGRGMKIARSLVGPYITSLEMQGCSITLLKADEEILKYWDAPADAPAFKQ